MKQVPKKNVGFIGPRYQGVKNIWKKQVDNIEQKPKENKIKYKTHKATSNLNIIKSTIIYKLIFSFKKIIFI
jgi:hypothetical protein